MLKNRNISAISFAIALWAFALIPLHAQDTPQAITSFGVHSLVAGNFNRTYFGVNGAVLTPLQENTFAEFSALLHFSQTSVNSYSGIGLHHISKTASSTSYYAKLSSGISILTKISDVGMSQTDSFFDELSHFGIGAQAGFGARFSTMDIGFVGLYQNLPGTKFWTGIQTGFWF